MYIRDVTRIKLRGGGHNVNYKSILGGGGRGLYSHQMNGKLLFEEGGHAALPLFKLVFEKGEGVMLLCRSLVSSMYTYSSGSKL